MPHRQHDRQAASAILHEAAGVLCIVRGPDYHACAGDGGTATSAS